MKKVLAVFMAAVMMVTAFGMFSFAADEEKYTLDMALAEAPAGSVVLLFNTSTAKLGNIYDGVQPKQITEGANAGCWAFVSATYAACNPVTLPGIKDAGTDMVGNWLVLTPGLSDTGKTFANSSLYVIPEDVVNSIVFYAQFTPVEKTPVIETIMGVFFKVINALTGGTLDNPSSVALAFAKILSNFGIEF